MPTDPVTNQYDALPLGVCLIDRSMRVHGWNRMLEQWSGIAREEIVGRRLPDSFPGMDDRRLLTRLRNVFVDRVPLVLSTALHRHFLPMRLPGGDLMPQRTHVRPFGADSELAIVMIEDLSQPMAQLDDLRRERRRLEESEASLRRQREELEATNVMLKEASRRAEQASRSKSEFLANMSHEIRTPLTAILGFTDILVSDADPEVCQNAAETIRRNGEHLLAIVNDVLDLSKIEAGKLQADPHPCSPRTLAEQVVSLMQARAESKGIALAAEFGDGLPETILSDATRLRQVLMNLVGNAVKFTDEGRVTLRLGVDSGGGRLCFAVEDTGIGIAADKLEHVFQPFCQADSSAQRRYGGTGLGLAICYRLARILGGDIRLTSELGVGSTFSLFLPTGAEPGASTASADRIGGRGRPGRGGPASDATDKPLADRRILVAEDGPDNQRLIGYHLKKAGARVTIVSNGQQAVDAIFDVENGADPFELVLMDMQMPVLDGYQATRTLRDRGHTGPIVALTAHAMDGDREKTLAAGCDAYATKPIDAPRLIRTLGEHLAGARLVAK